MRPSPRLLLPAALLGLLSFLGCGGGSPAAGPALYEGYLSYPPETAALAGVPAVPVAWRDDVLARHVPIRSLEARDTNFSDLQPLKAAIGTRRLVQLGESGHGVAEFSKAKVRLIRFLHEEMGFDVIAFESSIYEFFRTQEQLSQLSPERAMLNSIFGVWDCREALALFEYLKQAQDSARPLVLAGFDNQTSSNLGRLDRPEQLRDLVARIDPAYAEQVKAFDTAWLKAYGDRANRQAWLKANLGQLEGQYGDLERFLGAHMAELQAACPDRPLWPLIAQRTVWSVPWFARELAADPDSMDPVVIRDQAMAENLGALLDRIYPDKKVITWAHNFHIQKRADAAVYIDPNGEWSPPPFKNMGKWVHEKLGSQAYTVGLFMVRGKAADNSGETYDIPVPSPKSLEALMYTARRRQLFIDLAAAPQGTPWIDGPLIMRSWGVNDERYIPRQQYDGLIIVDTTHPPDYLY